MVYRRLQYSEIKTRIEEPRGKIQVIVGPRQVGKSTLIGQVLEECQAPYGSYSADDIVGADANWLAQLCKGFAHRTFYIKGCIDEYEYSQTAAIAPTLRGRKQLQW